MKKWYSLFLMFVLLVVTNVHAIVDPMENTWVHDYGDIISEKAENEINNRIDSLGGGAQVVVVTVDFFDGYSAEDYAYKLFNEWGIGDKTENNGVLLLVSMGEEEYYYLQGSGLEKKLPSSTLGRICDDYLVDDLIDGDYDSAFVNTVDAICSKIDNLYAPGNSNVGSPVTNNEEMMSTLISFMFFIVFLVVVVAILFAPSGTRRVVYGPYRRPRVHRYHHPSMIRPRDAGVYHRPPTHSNIHHGPSSMGRPSGGGSSFGGSRSFGGGRSRGGGGGGSFGKR